jgi:hypothetical protein
MFSVGLQIGDAGALAVGFFTPEAGILAGAIQFIPNLFQFGGMVGVPLDQGLKLIEHAGDILCYADLIQLGVVGLDPRFLSLGPRPIAFIAQRRAQAFKFRVGDQVHDALQKTRDGQWG